MDYFKEVQITLELGSIAEIKTLAEAEHKRMGHHSNMLAEIIEKCDEALTKEVLK